MSKVMRLGIGSLLALLMLTPLVAAFGVTAPYWKENPLEMYPGQTQTVTLRLQNMIGNEDIALDAEVTGGEELATLLDDRTYLVAFGQKNVEVPVEITIPKDTPLGGPQEIEVTLTQVPIEGEEAGILEISGAVITNIPIFIKNEAEIKQAQEAAAEEVAGAAVTDLSGGSALLVAVVIIGLILIIAAVVVANRLKNERRPY